MRVDGIAGGPLHVVDTLAGRGHGRGCCPVGRRVQDAAEERHRVEEARRDRRADMLGALHQPVFMADAAVEEDAVQEFRAVVEEEHVLVAGLEIDAKTFEWAGLRAAIVAGLLSAQ